MKNTIYYNISEIKEIRKVTGRRFVSYFDSVEYNKLMEYFLQDKKKRLFNGVNTRLDSIIHEDGGDILTISNIQYFDYMTSNILLLHKQNIIEYFTRRKEFELVMRLHDFYQECEKYSTIREILDAKWLANQAAIGMLIKDRNGKYGIVKRGRHMAVSAGFWGVSVSGCIEDDDFNADNPIIKCCLREAKEELNINLLSEDIRIRGISFDKNKLQPIILCDGVVNDTWGNMLENCLGGEEYDLEVSGIYPMDKNELSELLRYSNMTEAARVHIQLHAIKGKWTTYIANGVL